MTTNTHPQALATDVEHHELLLDAYEGELLGEVLFRALADQAQDDRTRRTSELLERVEVTTAATLRPVVERHGVVCDEADLARRSSEVAASFAHKHWRDIWTEIVPLAVAALDRFRRLRELSDEQDAPRIDLLVAHEESLLEFARRELDDDPDAAAPLEAYLLRAAQMSPQDAAGHQTNKKEFPVLTESSVENVPGVDDEILARASAMVPLLRSNGTRAENEARIPDEYIKALDESNLWGLTKPRVHGGLETNVRTTVEALAEVGRGCGSTSWVLMILVTEQWVISFLPREAQEAIYDGTRGSRPCGTFAPTATTKKVDGGYVVSGAWTYASGCLHADWCFGGIPITDDEGNVVDYGQALMPMDALRVDHTWRVTGLKGTGSHTVIAEEVFVPEYMVLPTVPAANGAFPPIYDGSLYRSAFVPTLALFVVAPLVGMAKAALELTLARVPDRALPYTTYAEGRNAPATQNWVAEAATRIDTAALHLARVADHIDRAAAGEVEPLTLDDHARYRQDVGWITKQTRQAMELLMDANGSSGFNESSPVQRFWRDVAIASRHGFLLPGVNQEIYGAHLLGGEQIAALL